MGAPARDLTERVAVLETKHEDLLTQLELRFAGMDARLVSVASSTKWTLRTLIGLLVTLAGGFVLLYLKG